MYICGGTIFVFETFRCLSYNWQQQRSSLALLKLHSDRLEEGQQAKPLKLQSKACVTSINFWLLEERLFSNRTDKGLTEISVKTFCLKMVVSVKWAHFPFCDMLKMMLSKICCRHKWKVSAYLAVYCHILLHRKKKCVQILKENINVFTDFI